MTIYPTYILNIVTLSKSWFNPKTRRYYRAEIYQDLLGDWVLVRHWGAANSRLGNSKTDVITTYEEGLEKLESIIKQRHKRDYHLLQ